MKLFLLIPLLLLASCTQLPQLFQSVEEIATDDALEVKIDKDAFQKKKDVHVVIDIVNQDPNK